MPRPINPLPTFTRGGQRMSYEEFLRTRPGSVGSQADTAYNRARQANLRRYRQIKGGYRNLQRRGMNIIEGYGVGEESRIAQAARERASKAAQFAVSRGLANTSASIYSSQYGQAAVDKIQEMAYADLSDRMAQMKLNWMGSVVPQRLQFMERRTDEYPDMRTALDMGFRSGVAQGVAPTPRVTGPERIQSALQLARQRIDRIRGYRR